MVEQSELNKTWISFVDFDDTIFPTSLFKSNKLNLGMLKMLEAFVFTLIRSASRLGKLLFITNAYPAWIREATLFLPKTSNFIRERMFFSRFEFGPSPHHQPFACGSHLPDQVSWNDMKNSGVTEEGLEIHQIQVQIPKAAHLSSVSQRDICLFYGCSKLIHMERALLNLGLERTKGVISIGDSEGDLLAAQSLANRYNLPCVLIRIDARDIFNLYLQLLLAASLLDTL